MLNHSIGTITWINGREFLATKPGLCGHAVYGPYIPVPPGQWVVEFSLCLPHSADAGPYSAAIIDVTSDFGCFAIAMDFVMLAELGEEPRTIPLAFDLAEERILEFRVHIGGRTPLLVADNPALRPRHIKEDLPVRKVDQNSGVVLRRLFAQGVRLHPHGNDVTIAVEREAVGTLFDFAGASNEDLARSIIAKRVWLNGDPDNSLYRAFIGGETATISPPQPIPFTSSLCQQVHFSYDQYRYWTHAIKIRPIFHRKYWEHMFIAQALFERGFLASGKKGLVFGAGQEPLPALFASFGVSILATDQAPEDAERSGWSATGQHTYSLDALNQRGICTERMFNELVSFMPVDMNDIPASLDGQFDFCWSSCSLEHLGSLEHGLAFIENSMKTLRSGGIAVHTTEFNLSSNDETVETPGCSFYRRRDIEDVVARLERKGHEVSPIDWTIGGGFAERVVDLPPYPYGGSEPHIRARVDRFDVTSIGLIIT